MTAISDEAIARSQQTDPVLQNLLSIDDPDWAKFQNDDPEWFLRVAGTAIRRFCGWHVFPNIRQHLTQIQTGAKGVIMLPSRHVTEVERLTLSHGEHREEEVIHHSHYLWFEAGYIELKGTDWLSGAYYYGTDPYYLPVTQPGIAACTFYSGYNAVPDDIKEVAFELATQSMTLKTGNVKMLATPGEYRIELSQDAGLTLNKDQMNRLGPYRLQPIA